MLYVVDKIVGVVAASAKQFFIAIQLVIYTTYIYIYILLHDWEGNTGEIFFLRSTVSARLKGGTIPRSRTARLLEDSQ